MHHKRIAAAAVTALAVAATPAIAAEQGAPAKTAKPLGSAVVAKDKASAKLKVRYSCKSGETLWISLKQTKSGKKSKALKAESSSQVAATWWQSHRNAIKCDGKNHTKKFKVDKVEEGSKGTLRKGSAWLQFCVTKGEGQDATLTVSVAKWVSVK
jgi:hypothetical protein